MESVEVLMAFPKSTHLMKRFPNKLLRFFQGGLDSVTRNRSLFYEN